MSGLPSQLRIPLLGFILLVSTACPSTGPPSKLSGDTLTFALPDIEGEIVRSSDARFSGRVVLVDVWGTWCDPCQRSVPFFVELQERYRDDGLEIVGIAFESPASVEARRNLLRKAVESHSINYTILDGGTTSEVQIKLPDIASFEGFPALFLIDFTGRVVYTKTGFFPRQRDAIERQVRRALGLG